MSHETVSTIVAGLLCSGVVGCAVSPEPEPPSPERPVYTEAILREPVFVGNDWADSADLVFDSEQALRKLRVEFRSGATVIMTTEPEEFEADMYLQMPDGSGLRVRSDILWDEESVWVGFLDLDLPYSYTLD